MSNLEAEFNNDMRGIYERAKKECKYIATRYLQMLNEYGGLRTAKRLVTDKKIHEGLVNLYLFGRLDLTVEKLVLNEKYRSLFNEEEIKKAKRRLKDLNYSI